MKKLVFLVSSVAMASAAAISAPAAAQNENSAKSTVEFCEIFGNDENGPGLPTKGSCISFFRSGDIPGLCKELKDFGVLELAGFKSQGECVSTLRKL